MFLCPTAHLVPRWLKICERAQEEAQSAAQLAVRFSSLLEDVGPDLRAMREGRRRQSSHEKQCRQKGTGGRGGCARAGSEPGVVASCTFWFKKHTDAMEAYGCNGSTWLLLLHLALLYTP
jgi:hypothetical protein